MKRATGWASVVLGVVLAALGFALMVMLGPDSRVTSGPHAIQTDGSVVVTAPRLITWSGVQIDVLAELPAQKPVFVGLGNTVDVQSLVGGTERIEIATFQTPWKPTFRQRDGRAFVQGAPTALDWWYVDSAGVGGASISTTLPDEPVSLAVISVGASNLSGLQVSLAYGIKGGFAKGAGLVLLGVGGAIGGLVLRRSAQLDEEYDRQFDAPAETEGGIEEVVYLIVDEHGVEHELTAEEVETGGYEVVDESEPAQESESEPRPTPSGERVVYVFVDEEGVEHELGEDDLDDFEVADEELPDHGGESR
ncbi:MAG: hypothetical protein WB508_02890 [Aeromicrobium sp.]|uniref:hypothetical protein n=1 Tax=Aeromicrobium sp. TaxID=1871063 RepID=UPI003C5267C3